MKSPLPILVTATILLLSCMNSDDPPLLAAHVNSSDSFFESMESNRQWPSYRGYFASGYLDDANLPDSFNIETSYHVKWNIEIPGLGLS
ncbi:MAG: hypothetical protein E4H10_13855, partial [Bacteroidia bacterium]